MRTSSKAPPPQRGQRVADPLGAPHAVHRKGSCTISPLPGDRPGEPLPDDREAAARRRAELRPARAGRDLDAVAAGLQAPDGPAAHDDRLALRAPDGAEGREQQLLAAVQAGADGPRAAPPGPPRPPARAR